MRFWLAFYNFLNVFFNSKKLETILTYTYNFDNKFSYLLKKLLLKLSCPFAFIHGLGANSLFKQRMLGIDGHSNHQI
jgi:hypothetical protein